MSKGMMPESLPYSTVYSGNPGLLTGDRSTAQWFVVHSKPRSEKSAGVYLRRLGIETLCPYLLQRKVIRRRQIERGIPLFPGYLFARFDPETEFRAVQYATGVRCVVCFGEILARVEDTIIESIKNRIHQGYITVTKSATFFPGQKVRIHHGPLQGFEAVFECEMSDQQRVALLLKTVAYQARVVVPLDQIAEI